jgi:hypothetical protein
MAGKMAGEWDAVNKAHRLLAQHTAEEPLDNLLGDKAAGQVHVSDNRRYYMAS